MDLVHINANIIRLAEDLDKLGSEIRELSKTAFALKQELYSWELQQDNDIRSKEEDGKLELTTGNIVKLTDRVRESLTRYGKREKFAQYEAIKRQRDILKMAIDAKRSALMGYQTLANTERDEMKMLNYQV